MANSFHTFPRIDLRNSQNLRPTKDKYLARARGQRSSRFEYRRRSERDASTAAMPDRLSRRERRSRARANADSVCGKLTHAARSAPFECFRFLAAAVAAARLSFRAARSIDPAKQVVADSSSARARPTQCCPRGLWRIDVASATEPMMIGRNAFSDSTEENNANGETFSVHI